MNVVRWAFGGVGALFVVAVALVIVFVVATRNPTISSFYTPPSELSSSAGTVIRSEPFVEGLPTGTQGWKVLYASTDPQGQPIAVSGLVLASIDAAPGPRPVLAWSHGTTGVVRACAPSLTDDPLDGIPDMTGPLDRGWVVVLTDYPGLGTPGPHPYLVGQSEGRAVLDSVRAAHNLGTVLDLDDRYAIWGHSQGGHAALFAGQLAPEYLPEYELAGVAALAPATRLQENFAATAGTAAGNLLTIFAIESWTEYYPDIPDDTLTADAREPAGRIADVCLNQSSRFRLLIAGQRLPTQILAIDPVTDPTWIRRLDENTPNPTGITSPVFVAQGLADDIVAPDVTITWVTARCSTDAPTVFHTYPDVSHVAVVGPGGTEALSWTIDRFEGTTTPNDCPTR